MRRFLPLFLLCLLIGIVWVTGIHEKLSFDTVKENRDRLTSIVQQNFVKAALLFSLLYILSTTLSIPGATVLTITGGFLFGQTWGTIWVVLSATTGATFLFLIARTALGESLRQRAGPWYDKMKKGFTENAFFYLLTLRLIPIFPFFVVNLVPAFLGVSLRTYILATGLGIIPGSFVYVSVGTGLGSLFDRGETLNLKGILTPEILTALGGLALLSLLPVLYKKLKQKRKDS